MSGNHLPSTIPTPTLPRVLPKLLKRLATLNAVPRCSGRLTSVISASQLGVLADCAAEAKNDSTNNNKIQGFKTICWIKPMNMKIGLLSFGKDRFVHRNDKHEYIKWHSQKYKYSC